MAITVIMNGYNLLTYNQKDYRLKQNNKGKKTMENNTQQTEKYKIIKFRKSGTQTTVLKNLSLNEAKKYCSRPDTRGKNWFCGFTKQ